MTTTAFFDLDYTLLNASSGVVYVRESVKQRRVPWWIVSYIALSHKLGRIDFGQAHAGLIPYVGKQGFQQTASFFETLIERYLLPRLSKKGREKIAWHQQQGHRVVIISASIEELVKPMAEHLGLGDDYLCTRLAVQDDRYTGQLDGPQCYGAGKVEWVKRWATENQLSFPETIGYVYTDSSSDLPLLELAQNPIAVNPSRKLAKIARARGWPIERFD
ncbi:MAG: HAD family hydrolase [Anaerolineae bacterium]|nr:HAD family hydrolase [Anaerolineae bacterium]